MIMINERRQVSVRSVSRITTERLREVHEATRLPMGALVDQAVSLWWNSLPVAAWDRNGGFSDHQ